MVTAEEAVFDLLNFSKRNTTNIVAKQIRLGQLRYIGYTYQP